MYSRHAFFFFFSSRRRHTRSLRDWSSDVCSSDLPRPDRRSRRRGSGPNRARRARRPPAGDRPRDDGGAVTEARGEAGPPHEALADAADQAGRLQRVTERLSGALTPQQVLDAILTDGLRAAEARAGAIGSLS